MQVSKIGAKMSWKNEPEEWTKMRNAGHFTPTLEVRAVTRPRKGGGRSRAGVHPRASHGRENSQWWRSATKTKSLNWSCWAERKTKIYHGPANSKKTRYELILFFFEITSHRKQRVCTELSNVKHFSRKSQCRHNLQSFGSFVETYLTTKVENFVFLKIINSKQPVT